MKKTAGRPGAQGYWAKYDHIRLGRPEVSGDAEVSGESGWIIHGNGGNTRW